MAIFDGARDEDMRPLRDGSRLVNFAGGAFFTVALALAVVFFCAWR